MIKPIFTILLLFYYASCSGQTNDLSNIKTVLQAEAYIESNPKAKGRLFSIQSSNDTSEIVLPLYGKKVGFIFRIDKNIYKILKVDSALSFRVNYIYVSGEQISKKQIDSLRQEIILKYKAGTSFFELVQQYNMDGNPTGDTGWFTKNMMVKEFENAVKSHKKNEIFTVDTPGENWYHVVLKTHDNTFIKKMTLLKVQDK